jgi:hypothetical protein
MSNEINSTTSTGQTQQTGDTGDAIAQAEKNSDEYQKIAEDGEQSGSNDMAYYLKLQRAMMQEQQAYSAVSTVMKARSDASMTAIRNFK